MVRIRTAGTAIVLLLAACGGGGVGEESTTDLPSTSPPAPSPSAAESSTTAVPGPRGTTSSSTTTTTATPTTTTTMQDGGVTPPPSLIQAIIADLASREGVGADEVELLSTETVDWPDASLGCPVAGVSYIQVVTPGYHIILGIGEETFDYRATANGSFRLCQNPLAGSSSPHPDS